LLYMFITVGMKKIIWYTLEHTSVSS
jgi:hypothetical protein